MELVHERVSGGFEKWRLQGLPVRTAIHHFTGPEIGDPHDHPWDFHTHILVGGYVEEIYTIHPNGMWTMELFTRRAGTDHHVKATCIHRVIEILSGSCVTFVETGEQTRQWSHWRFDHLGARPLLGK